MITLRSIKIKKNIEVREFGIKELWGYILKRKSSAGQRGQDSQFYLFTHSAANVVDLSLYLYSIFDYIAISAISWILWNQIETQDHDYNEYQHSIDNLIHTNNSSQWLLYNQLSSDCWYQCSFTFNCRLTVFDTWLST